MESLPYVNIVTYHHSPIIAKQLIELCNSSGFISPFSLPYEIQKKVVGCRKPIYYIKLAPLIIDKTNNNILWWMGGWALEPKDVFEKSLFETKFVTCYKY